MRTRGYSYQDNELYRLPAFFYLSYGPAAARYNSSNMKVLPTVFEYISQAVPRQYSLKNMTKEFISEDSGAQKAGIFGASNSSIDDIFGMKIGRSQDQIEMILQGIQAVEQVRYDNIQSLNYDLLKVSNMHLERLHDYDTRDKTWLDIQKQYLGLKSEIRKENSNFNKSVSILSKDLREALIDWKKQKQKGEMMQEDETGLDN